MSRSYIVCLFLIGCFFISCPDLSFAASKVCVNKNGKVVIRKRCRQAKGLSQMSISLLNETVAANVPSGSKGDTGPVGPQGPQGKQGAKGDAGSNGIDGSSCSVSNDGAGAVTISCTDGTSESFAIPFCGNGLVEAGEACDGQADCNETCSGSKCKDSGGAFVGDACWFAGGAGANCDATCSGKGLVYDDATRTFAGSHGTNANCEDVAIALGFNVLSTSSSQLSLHVGCHYQNGDPSYMHRATDDPTTSSASFSVITRLCACKDA